MDRTGAYCELIMSSNYDYIMNQIEKASQLLAALISSKKSEQKQEAEINKTLAELTGLDIDLFAQKENVATARVLLGLIDDEQRRALALKLFELKVSKQKS